MNTKSVSSFASSTNAIVAINGGFFGGTKVVKSTSLVASAGDLLALNADPIERDHVPFRPTRATLGKLKGSGEIDLKWTYAIKNPDNSFTVYAYPTSAENGKKAPGSQPGPGHPDGAVTWDLEEGMGGGPCSLTMVRVSFEPPGNMRYSSAA